MGLFNYHRWRTICIPHGLIYTLLGITTLCLFILTIIYSNLWRNSKTSVPIFAVEKGIIGSPVRLPNDGRYVQWTFLHLNDVYELLPLDQGRKGGLARVAYIRKLLKQENPHTYTILGGDFVSPSALGTSNVNGTMLNGRQMVATFNTLGLDYLTFGNHEFDLTEKELLARMYESKFTWISTNVFRGNSSNDLFGSSISHKIITIDEVRILMIGLTIGKNYGYVHSINQSFLIPYVQQYLRKFPNGTYDVLIAITHLDIAIDIELVQKIPQIDLVLGGHEHENSYYLRGTKYTPIYKADSNAFTVYILRCAFNLNTKQFHIYDTLSRINADVPEEKKTAEVANYWFNLGIEGFRALGFEPLETVSCLPIGLELDGRSESVRNYATLLTDLICESMIKETVLSKSTIALFNSGSIRIDDVLRETITQYDILRTLPFPNNILALSVPGSLLARLLTKRLANRGAGSFLLYIGVETLDKGKTWIVNGTDISTSDRLLIIATTEYLRRTTELNSTSVTVLQQTNVSQTKGLIDYMKMQYSSC